jgi:mono/diheme cytochrome c family protein
VADAGGSSGSAGAVADAGGPGLPCEVEALLHHYCVGCHSSPPVGGAPEALLSYENLAASATLDPSQKLGAYSVALMQSGVMPPKPAAAPTASEVAAVAAWVAAGMPREGCATPVDAGSPAVNPYDTPLKCTSGATWPPGNGSELMEPGGACISCHLTSEEAPTYTIAGTVYPSAHEPDECNGVATSSSGALSVLITEATGTSHILPVNSVGNFFYEGTIATPFDAQVQAGNAVRVMVHTQTSGDCNGCHTVNGSSNTPGATSAPGRVMAP